MMISLNAKKIFSFDNPDLINLSLMNKLNSPLIFVKISHISQSILDSLKQKKDIPLTQNECLLIWYKHEIGCESWEIIQTEFLEWVDVCYLYKCEKIFDFDRNSVIIKCHKYSNGVLQSQIFLICSMQEVSTLEEKFILDQRSLLYKNLKDSKYFYLFAKNICDHTSDLSLCDFLA